VLIGCADNRSNAVDGGFSHVDSPGQSQAPVLFGLRIRFEFQGRRVDAVAETIRTRAIIKDMTKMATAIRAFDFGPDHPK
jgi:hypothetical protein